MALTIQSPRPAQTGHYARRRRREFLDFMNEVVAANPGREMYVILDNLNTHKPKRDRWLQRHPQLPQSVGRRVRILRSSESAAARRTLRRPHVTLIERIRNLRTLTSL